MSGEILVNNIQNRCNFLSKDTIKLALLRSYIADVTFISDKGSLTVFELPAALFFLNVIEECALSSIRDTNATPWPVPDTDENLFITTVDGFLHIKADSEGVNWQGVQTFCMQKDDCIRLFFQSLRNLIVPDKILIEEIGAKIIDNPVIRHLFDYRYI